MLVGNLGTFAQNAKVKEKKGKKNFTPLKEKMDKAAKNLSHNQAATPGCLYELPRTFGEEVFGIPNTEKSPRVARFGVHGDGSCAYHSICAALNLDGYNSLPEKEQKTIAYKFRCSFREGLTHERLKKIISKNRSKSPTTLAQIETALCDPKIWADETAIRLVGESIGINLIFLDAQKNKLYCGVHHEKAMSLQVPTMVILWINHIHFEPLAIITKFHEHTVEVKILLDHKNPTDLKMIRHLMDRYTSQCK